jgi:hypothetical protein
MKGRIAAPLEFVTRQPIAIPQSRKLRLARAS